MATLPKQTGDLSVSPTTSISHSWKTCLVCQTTVHFKTPLDFCRHLRDYHCKKEGGSFVCHYGPYGVCPSLPVDGVSDQDYDDHVVKDHVRVDAKDGDRIGRGRGHSILDMAANPSDQRSSGDAGKKTSTVMCEPSSEPSVVQDQYKWTVYMSQVNLPAVLNDPRLTRRETEFFTKTWGEGFQVGSVAASPLLPVITKHHFARYLRKISARHKERLKYHGEGSVAFDHSTQHEAHDAFPLTYSSVRQDKYQADLDAIPKLFMHAGFNLENPDTFNTVFPWSHIEAASNQSGKPKQSSKLLQEKLSHYLDIVEVQIAKQISLRSKSFFQIMTSQDKLQENMHKTCAAIKLLRDKIHDLDQVLVAAPFKLMKLCRSRNNLLQLYNKLRLVSTVQQTQPTLQLLLATNEFVGALDLISTTQEVLATELLGVHSFRHLGSQLVEMEKLIDKMMQEDFVHYATSDLNRPLIEGSVVMEEEDGTEMYTLSDTQERLVAVILGLLRQGKTQFLDTYQTEACTALKAIIKQTVIEAVADAEDLDSENTNGSLADQMRLLNYNQWMSLLQHTFENLLVLLNRAKVVCSIINEVLLAASGGGRADTSTGNEDVFHEDITEDTVNDEGDETKGQDDNQPIQASKPVLTRFSVSTDVDTFISPADYKKVSIGVRGMLVFVCDHAHDRCVKLLLARSKDGFLEKLSASEFVQLSRCIEKFVSDSEVISGKRSTSLRASLQGQANRFVARFHDERKTKLSLILDNERWKQADVPAEFQDLVNHISTTGVLRLPAKKSEFDKKSDCLLVNGERYAVVGTVLMLLKMLIEYCQCVDDIPSVSSDILTRLVDLLKMFNSRSCQLILGAGALQLVGLKTITTKNLALASRCLQLIVEYLPRVRQHFEERLPTKHVNMLKHLDQVAKDYKDHVAELSNKFVVIMDSMMDMTLTNWEVKAPMPSPCFRSLCKQMAKLNEAIADLLPAGQIYELFCRINASFKLRLRAQLIKLGVTNDGGPQHGLVMADVAFYFGNLRALSGLAGIDDNTDDIWDKR